MKYQIGPFDAFGGVPELEELASAPVTDDSKLTITFWNPERVPDYLRLYAVDGSGEQVRFTMAPADTEGAIDM